MRKILFAFVIALFVSQSSAQSFLSGQVLTAAALNSAFSGKAPVNNAVFTGTTTIPGVAITGGTITGLSAPIPFGSGGTNATTATGATSSLLYLAPFANAVTRSLAAKYADHMAFGDFGGVCDGFTTNHSAWLNAFAALAAGKALEFPAGNCLYDVAVVAPVVSNAGIIGAGGGQTTLTYVGANTTNDLITIGDGTTSISGWSLSGFTLQSNTKMTAGAALHLKRMQNGNSLYDVNAGSFTQSSVNLWTGVWLDNVNVFKYNYGNIQVQNDGLAMNGSATSDEGSDIFLDNLAVTFSSVGYHVGGGQGGVYFAKTLAFDNNVNYRVDNGLAARKNREIFFSDQAISDGNTNYGIHINDTLTSNSPIVINAHVGSAGLFGSGGAGYNIYVQSWPSGRISIGPGQLYNATSDGLRVSDTTTQISIDPGRYIFNNGGYGINATASDNNISNLSQFMSSNTSGNYSSNVHLMPLTLNAGATFKAVSGNTQVTLDNAGSQQSVLLLNDNGATKWQFGLNTNDHAFMFDNTAGNYVFDAAPNGTLAFTPVVSFAAGVLLPVTTVSGLPTCNTAAKGRIYAVSDASSPSWNATLTGGGSTEVLAQCNGTNWTAH